MKTVYIIIENNAIHRTKAFSSITALKKFYKHFVSDIKQLDTELLKLKENEYAYKKEYDVYISFQGKNGCGYNVRVIKKIVNTY